jgi:hypothetical protein
MREHLARAALLVAILKKRDAGAKKLFSEYEQRTVIGKKRCVDNGVQAREIDRRRSSIAVSLRLLPSPEIAP